MLIKLKVAGADKAVWINPEHVSGVLASAGDVATVFLVGGVEQRVEGHPDDIVRLIESLASDQAPKTTGSAGSQG